MAWVFWDSSLDFGGIEKKMDEEWIFGEGELSSFKEMNGDWAGDVGVCDLL